MKILVIRFSSIGDIVLTTPVVRCLKNQLPGAEIHYATKAEYEQVLRGNPYIDKFHFLNSGILSLITELKAEKFDYVIDLHSNLRTSLLKFGIGSKIKWYRFKKLNLKKWLYVNLKIDTLPNTHIVNRYMKPAEKLGVIYDGRGLDYFISEEEEKVFLAILPDLYDGNYICLVPGAKFQTKSIPIEKCIEITEKCERPVIILGGHTEAELGNKIVQQAKKENITNLCGKLNLAQSAAALKHAHSVITTDTGLMHIASAYDKKIISVWGNTVPKLGMYPFLADNSPNKAEIVEVSGLSCRPCSKIGFAKCPKGHFDCMMKQNVADIIAKCDG